jgi:hypothetical protein
VHSKFVTTALTAASCAALAAGCGGGKTSSQAAAPSQPIAPTCGIDNFAAPHIGPAAGTGGGWELDYQYPPKAPRPPAPGETTVLAITEKAPIAGRKRVQGGHDVVVAGRQVSLLKANGGRAYVAEWTTKRARYIGLATGSKPDTLERVIGCLP